MLAVHSLLNRFLPAIAAVSLLVAPLSAARAEDGKVTVFAAASLKNALEEIDAAWSAETGKTVTASFAASSALAKQIEEGAPADILVSADLKWMDYLEKAKQIKSDTRVTLLGNQLVLVAPKDSAAAVTVEKGFALGTLLGDGKLAMGNTDSVPAGVYGKEALTNLGVWADVESKVAQAENVRAALLLVSRGEAPLGIVYATDAISDPSVKVIGTFPEDSHKPIVYPAAVTTASASAEATAYLAFLGSEKARALFEKQGFKVLAPQGN
ncbi:molybdate ABC transporter substrate-binding protein [Pararhizobium sp.]|uniref:molybdate ABC transporter substrate-binding protein n=1 Tax=Pararhizobium sp. TaxID=1977563 RepID=UPI0027291CD3|nr:molybdate ABC transporter substrate-binding protein [Pararhizobium sp.]MDO9415705.1 molybdate ABC transporter substrate-binding protein [Pararhizobium sp.]